MRSCYPCPQHRLGSVRAPLRAGDRADHGALSDAGTVHYVNESVGIAAGFPIAAIHLCGLATLTHTPSPMAFLHRLLHRSAQERPFLLLPVGSPAPDARVPAIDRRRLGEILVFDRPETAPPEPA